MYFLVAGILLFNNGIEAKTINFNSYPKMGFGIKFKTYMLVYSDEGLIYEQRAWHKFSGKDTRDDLLEVFADTLKTEGFEIKLKDNNIDIVSFNKKAVKKVVISTTGPGPFVQWTYTHK